jgi:DNA-binding NtrC family response regulator
VIDDEEIVLQTTRLILQKHGYRVLTAANGKSGMEAVEKHKEELSAVILDLTMPVMSGEEALKHIKQIAPQLSVILSSGYGASEAASVFGENNPASFLQKPSTVPNMLLTVKKAIEQNL